MNSIDETYIRTVLSIKGDFVTDELLAFLIAHYTEVIQVKTGATDIESMLFKDALISSIACHLSMTNPSSIEAPKKEVIGNFEEERKESTSKSKDPTWCDIKNESWQDLTKSVKEAYGFATVTRQGSYGKYGFY